MVDDNVRAASDVLLQSFLGVFTRRQGDIKAWFGVWQTFPSLRIEEHSADLVKTGRNTDER